MPPVDIVVHHLGGVPNGWHMQDVDIFDPRTTGPPPYLAPKLVPSQRGVAEDGRCVAPPTWVVPA
eukprot:12925382-Prorocentrum_lima.AAC.1